MAAPTRLPTAMRFRMRRMRFRMDDATPEHWVADSKFLSHFFNALSASFPEGEKFFIESVRRFESMLDPELREQVREFARQEGHHTHQHRVFNDIMTRKGISMAAYDVAVREVLDRARCERSELYQLALTASLEHLTALMSDHVLRRPELLDGMDDKLRPLWSWHAVEETEHKAVAFDVYHRVGGGYRMRARAMVEATLIFFLVVHSIQVDMMRRDRQPSSVADMLRGLDYLWGRPGFLRCLLGPYLRWFKPSFHPWDDDNSHLIGRWKADNARFIERIAVAA